MSKKGDHMSRKLTMTFTVVNVIAMMISTIIVSAVLAVIRRVPIFETVLKPPSDGYLLTLILASMLVSICISYAFNKVVVGAVKDLVDSLNLLAKGEYGTRLSVEKKKGPLLSLTNSFNTLAAELQNTEMLRSDFVNNFSHEFKTPIASIRGFAKLLKHDNLPKETREEYLDIIIDESTRLSDLATNVLSLTKVENQGILTDVTRYNLSEQLRRTICLFDKKLDARNLQLTAGFNEHMICANEEMLSQVWINLLDNAVKFSNEGGSIDVLIMETEQNVFVTIRNTGDGIDEEVRRRMFDKFYQGDTSHAAQGNGIGLAVVKKIIELHHGTIQVECYPPYTSFCVGLDKNLKESNASQMDASER